MRRSALRRPALLATCRNRLEAPPLLGCSTSPPLTCQSRVHSREPKFPSGRRGPPRQLMFRPRGFSPPRRLAPRKRSQACCILLPAMGFDAFCLANHRASQEMSGKPTRLLAPRLAPFEEFPSISSRAASLRPLHLLSLAARPVPKRRPNLIAVKLQSAEADPHVTRAKARYR
jgi:hypothetical protein